ncbi:MAG: hypothetical protein S0880_37470 [Actinomycetota bacterium]|nr:hypothetical protein [Actinomycetota bacterium]
MAKEAELVAGAIGATGDQAIEVAGVFAPRGFVGHMLVGAAAAGPYRGGTAADSISGINESDAVPGTPPVRTWRFVVAVSPTHVYLLNVGMGLVDLDPAHQELVCTFDRTRLHVEVHARVTFRRLVLEDLDTEERIELDGHRAHWKHATDVIHALLLEGTHGVEDDEAV